MTYVDFWVGGNFDAAFNRMNTSLSAINTQSIAINTNLAQLNTRLTTIATTANTVSNNMAQAVLPLGKLMNAGDSLLNTFVKLKFITQGLFEGVSNSGIGYAVKEMFELNKQMEYITANFRANLKDTSGKKTQNTMEYLVQESMTSPFKFSELAEGSKSLVLMSGGFNDKYKTMVKQMQILAAFKPEQGIQGAAFAQREAQSGQYRSMYQRFDLPAAMFHKYKNQGYNPDEVVSKVMEEVGLGSELIDRLASTLKGRMSTIEDIGEQIFRVSGKAGFNQISAALGNFADTFMKILQPNSTVVNGLEVLGLKIATLVSAGLDTLDLSNLEKNFLRILDIVGDSIDNFTPDILRFFQMLNNIGLINIIQTAETVLKDFFSGVISGFNLAWPIIKRVYQGLMDFSQLIGDVLGLVMPKFNASIATTIGGFATFTLLMKLSGLSTFASLLIKATSGVYSFGGALATLSPYIIQFSKMFIAFELASTALDVLSSKTDNFTKSVLLLLSAITLLGAAPLAKTLLSGVGLAGHFVATRVLGSVAGLAAAGVGGAASTAGAGILARSGGLIASVGASIMGFFSSPVLIAVAAAGLVGLFAWGVKSWLNSSHKDEALKEQNTKILGILNEHYDALKKAKDELFKIVEDSPAAKNAKENQRIAASFGVTPGEMVSNLDATFKKITTSLGSNSVDGLNMWADAHLKKDATSNPEYQKLQTEANIYLKQQTKLLEDAEKKGLNKSANALDKENYKALQHQKDLAYLRTTIFKDDPRHGGKSIEEFIKRNADQMARLNAQIQSNKVIPGFGGGNATGSLSDVKNKKQLEWLVAVTEQQKKVALAYENINSFKSFASGTFMEDQKDKLQKEFNERVGVNRTYMLSRSTDAMDKMQTTEEEMRRPEKFPGAKFIGNEYLAIKEKLKLDIAKGVNPMDLNRDLKTTLNFMAAKHGAAADPYRDFITKNIVGEYIKYGKKSAMAGFSKGELADGTVDSNTLNDKLLNDKAFIAQGALGIYKDRKMNEAISIMNMNKTAGWIDGKGWKNKNYTDNYDNAEKQYNEARDYKGGDKVGKQDEFKFLTQKYASLGMSDNLAQRAAFLQTEEIPKLQKVYEDALNGKDGQLAKLNANVETIIRAIGEEPDSEKRARMAKDAELANLPGGSLLYPDSSEKSKALYGTKLESAKNKLASTLGSFEDKLETQINSLREVFDAFNNREAPPVYGPFDNKPSSKKYEHPTSVYDKRNYFGTPSNK